MFILYINTLKLHTQKHHKYITCSLFHDLIEIYSFVTNIVLFIMLENVLAFLQQAFLSISIMSRLILNALVVEADLQLCGIKFSIKLVCANGFLIHLRRVSIEAVRYGFRQVVNNLFCTLSTLSFLR